MYSVEKKSGGRRTYEPMDPQPPADCIFTVFRYYSILAADETYRKRVTWLESAESSSVALHEYLGRHVPPDRPHGNSKGPEARPYKRTPATTMEAVAEGLRSEQPKSVYNRLIQQMDVDEAPRNSRSVKDKKHQLLRKRKATTTSDKEYRSVHRHNASPTVGALGSHCWSEEANMSNDATT